MFTRETNAHNNRLGRANKQRTKWKTATAHSIQQRCSWKVTTATTIRRRIDNGSSYANLKWAYVRNWLIRCCRNLKGVIMRDQDQERMCVCVAIWFGWKMKHCSARWPRCLLFWTLPLGETVVEFPSFDRTYESNPWERYLILLMFSRASQQKKKRKKTISISSWNKTKRRKKTCSASNLNTCNYNCWLAKSAIIVHHQ